MMCYTDYSYKTAERFGTVKADERTDGFMAKQADGRPRQKEINIYTACDRVPRHCARRPFETAEKSRAVFGIFASLPLWKTFSLHIHSGVEDSKSGFRFARLKGYEIVWFDFFSLLLTV